jgi:glycosyltransferase involved in cell wall biosynthesis
MRVCLVYDCLFPYTVGGGERWYRSVAERLVAAGHEVTYLTLRQWERGERPELPGVRVVAVGPRMSLYGPGGQRRILPPLVFGAGVLLHLLRHGRRYDAVHTSAFPYFSLLAAGLARPLGRFRLIVDWFEVWSEGYWREYLGGLRGRLGNAVQALCLRVPQRPFCFSQLHAQRLRDAGLRDVTVLRGMYAGPLEAAEPEPAESLVVFAGRHIPEKGVPALVPAIARARERVPGLRAIVFGDGPDRDEVLRLRDEHGLGDALELPGFAAPEEVERALRRALCMALPSRREGYGMVVIEAARLGTPSVVVAGPDNAAVELVDDGENGVVAPSAASDDLAAAIVRVHDAGFDLRRSTARWFDRRSAELALDGSLATVLAGYAGEPSARR